ncbi:hypothetical protein [Psychrobacter alimentarius]|uniref:hypothetical protein n=1 Tax=Psychrobacter alimentarius TaxID=261164 RepID=UPI003FD561F2
MQLDNTDHKIILDALYNLAVSENAELSDDISAMDSSELEQRLIALRQHFSILERKSDYYD